MTGILTDLGAERAGNRQQLKGCMVKNVYSLKSVEHSKNTECFPYIIFPPCFYYFKASILPLQSVSESAGGLIKLDCWAPTPVWDLHF